MFGERRSARELAEEGHSHRHARGSRSRGPSGGLSCMQGICPKALGCDRSGPPAVPRCAAAPCDPHRRTARRLPGGSRAAPLHPAAPRPAAAPPGRAPRRTPCALGQAQTGPAGGSSGRATGRVVISPDYAQTGATGVCMQHKQASKQSTGEGQPTSASGSGSSEPSSATRRGSQPVLRSSCMNHGGEMWPVASEACATWAGKGGWRNLERAGRGRRPGRSRRRLRWRVLLGCPAACLLCWAAAGLAMHMPLLLRPDHLCIIPQVLQVLRVLLAQQHHRRLACTKDQQAGHGRDGVGGAARHVALVLHGPRLTPACSAMSCLVNTENCRSRTTHLVGTGMTRQKKTPCSDHAPGCPP